MCLNIKRNLFQKIFGILPKVKIAKEDIIVYKVYELGKDSDFISMFNRTHHNYGLQEKVTLGVSLYLSFFTKKFVVNEGYHSYKFKKNIKYIFNIENYCAVKCIIPKGTEYYEGTSDGWKEGYVSDNIIISEIIYE